ncbi:Hypothetical predicted protein, partial [Pelobates cultripes]
AVSPAVPLKVVGGRGRTDRPEEGVNDLEPTGTAGGKGLNPSQTQNPCETLGRRRKTGKEGPQMPQ